MTKTATALADTPTENEIIDLTEQFEREQVANGQRHIDDGFGSILNDARVSGPVTPEWLALLDRPMTFLLPENRNRDAQQAKWNNSTAPLRAWIEGNQKDSTSGFSRHAVKPKKGYFPITFGKSASDARKAMSMVTVDAMALDVDSGNSFSDALDRCEELGLAVIGYTSFNDGTTESTVPRDAVRKALGHTNDVTDEELRGYLTDTGKYTAEHVASVSIADQARHEEAGLQIAYSHTPLEKFRLVFPLASPVEVAKLASTQRASLEVFASKVRGLGELIGVIFDQSCTDASRAFYMPAHRNNAEFALDIVRGRGLTFEELPEVGKTTAKNAFEIAGGNSGPAVETLSGLNLKGWAVTHGKRLEIARLIEFEAPDKARESKGSLLVIECPFDETHSNAGDIEDSACHTRDADGDVGFAWKCKHDSCAGHDRLDMLAKALADGWFEEAKLTDEDYLVPLGDDEDDEVIEDDRDAAAKVRSDLLEMVAGFAETTTEPEVREVIKQAIAVSAGEDVREALKVAIAGKTLIKAAAFNKLWKNLKKDSSRKRKAKADEPEIKACHIKDDYPYQVEYAQQCILESNEESPSLFQFGGAYATVDAVRRRIRVEESRDAMFSVLGKVTRWDAEMKLGDEWVTRKVAPPEAVVRALASDHDFSDSLPELLAVLSTPFFDRDGTLVDVDGYHAGAKVYLSKGDLVLPGVSRTPTAEDVAEAKRLIVEEVLADYPLAGMSRKEIMATLEGKNEDRAHAVTHTIAALLLPFCRDMIAGPTPGHVFTKPNPGTGASGLVNMLTSIQSGEPMAAMTFPDSAEEVRKTLSSALAEGKLAILFDNIGKAIASTELASAMTALTYQARILGKTALVTVPVRSEWIFTANNIEAAPEIVRRLVFIPMDRMVVYPELFVPENGWHHDDLLGWVSANRPELVWACLTIIQNWVSQGMVPYAGKKLASYENWSKVMGGILSAAGLTGFLEGQKEEQAKATDSTEDGLSQLVYALGEYPSGTVFRAGGSRPFDGKATVSIQEVLNGEARAELIDADNPDPIQINGWGYNAYDGSYTASGRIGREMKTFVRKPYEVGGEVLTFEELLDKRGGVSVFRMTKKTV